MLNKQLSINSLVWLRLYICVELLSTFGVAITDSRSFTYAVASSAGAFGWHVANGMAFIAFVCLMDVVINDILGDRFTFYNGLRYRLWLLMAVAFGCCTMIFLAAQINAWPAIPYYLLYTGGMVFSAVADIKLRSKEKYLKRKGNDQCATF